MNEPDQMPFVDVDFAYNPEPRCPCVLLLDTSGSMAGRPIHELNDGLMTFRDELLADSLSAKRVELAIVSFGPVQIETDFQTVDLWTPPTLTARGDTPMGSAIELAVQMINNRKQAYKKNGVSYYRPWVFLITDGGPTDNWQNASRLVHAGEESKSFLFFAVGVEGARMDILGQIAAKKPLQLKELRFRDLFSWLSNSLSSVSRSSPGDSVPLQNPATPDGWAST